MRYVYSVVRFVPDTARGEFINVGAIAGSDQSSDWKMRIIENPKRARQLDTAMIFDGVSSFMNQIGRRLDDYEAWIELSSVPEVDVSESWLDHLWQASQGIAQLSRPAPIVSETAEDVLDFVFANLIVDPARQTRSRRTKSQALAAIRDAYGQFGLRKPEFLREKEVIRGEHHQSRFDFVVSNGRVLQLTQAWSLARADDDDLMQEIKAWAFTMSDIIRRHGGHLVVGDQSLEVAKSVDVEVVYVPPQDESSQLLTEAKAAFADVQALAVPVEDAAIVGVRAHDLLLSEGLSLL